MNYRSFHYAEDGGVALLTLDDEGTRNALSALFWREIKDVFAEIARTSTVRVVVLRAEGPHFSSGIDRAMLASLFAPRPELEEGRRRDLFRRMVLDLQDSINVLEACDVPVLAAIQGACIGGALDLICAADCRFAADEAFFCVKETELGFTADLGVLQRLPKLVPPGIARELAYSSRAMKAQEALSHGLVNSVYSNKAKLDEAVMALAKTIAARSPLAITGAKDAFRYGAEHNTQDALKQMAVWQAGMALTNDVQKAVSAAAHGDVPEFDNMPRAVSLFPK